MRRSLGGAAVLLSIVHLFNLSKKAHLTSRANPAIDMQYGNYLEATTDNLNKLDGLVEDYVLYPKVDNQFVREVEGYHLVIPSDALDEMYCTYCHKSFKREVNNGIATCPICKRTIAYWY